MRDPSLKSVEIEEGEMEEGVKGGERQRKIHTQRKTLITVIYYKVTV